MEMTLKSFVRRYFYIHFIFGSAAVASATYDAAAA